MRAWFINCWLRFAGIAALLVLVGVWPGRAMAQSPLAAMTTRPSNSTCLAGNAPDVSGTAQFVRVFTELANYRVFDAKYSPVDASRIYFITRNGQLMTWKPGEAVVEALNISADVGVNSQATAYQLPGSEHWGLASFAFHPDFANNGWVFVLYNGRQANENYTTSYVARYTLKQGAGALTFDPASKLVIISQPQMTNGESRGWLHHFGNLTFGPSDGYLYIGSGDGTLNGSNYFGLVPSQDLSELRGKILRLDVNNSSTAQPYAIPTDNPFVTTAGARPEIWAYGVRNPWRFSIDPVSNLLWAGDVGQETVEEVDIIPRGGNMGWSVFEGNECRRGTLCDGFDYVKPVQTIYHQGQSMAVIGGLVYRGSEIPDLRGKYLYQIYPKKELYAISQVNGQWASQQIQQGTPNISAFFNDPLGEVYGVDSTGAIYKLVKGSGAVASNGIPSKLSQTGCFKSNDVTKITAGLIGYGVNSQLWSDGANKKRYMAIPNGQKIKITADGDFDFPIGSVLIKTFFFNRINFETRMLKLHNNGEWRGYTYKWNAQGNDADLVSEEGEDITVKNNSGATIPWHLPSRGECLQCHNKASNSGLGPTVAQLNGMFLYPTGVTGHQLITLNTIGMFDGGLPKPVYDLPALVDPSTSGAYATAIYRARSYLDANCSFCHRSDNGDLNSQLVMDFRSSMSTANMAVCNELPRLSDFGIAGARVLAPQHPDQSIIWYRMGQRGESSGQMPPLGTHLVHTQARNIVSGWITRADVCSTTIPDTDGDGVPDNTDNCRTIPNANQLDSDGDKIGDRCDGDFNNDLVVDATDKAMLQSAMGSSFGQSGYQMMMDFNLDGVIDAQDLAYFNSVLWPAQPKAGKPGPSGFRAIP